MATVTFKKGTLDAPEYEDSIKFVSIDLETLEIVQSDQVSEFEVPKFFPTRTREDVIMAFELKGWEVAL